MVSTSSTAAQAREMEKKRKQTLERAKANHLSRQLQMRLQYARLKVEHGWQKQNLNEVENLYFHHSHQRGSKSYPTSSSFLTVAQKGPSFLSSPSKLSEPSYRSWLQSLSRSVTMDAVLDARSNQEGTGDTSNNGGASPALLSQTPATLQSTPTSFTQPEAQSSRVSQPSLLQTPTQPSNPLPPQTGTSAIDNPTLLNLLSENVISSPTTFNDTLSYFLPLQMQAPTSPPHANSAAPATTPVIKAKKLFNRSHPSQKGTTPLTSKDMFNFNSSSLTYDSFWSGLQSKSYPGLKGAAGTVAGASVTSGGFPGALVEAEGAPSGMSSTTPTTPTGRTSGLPPTTSSSPPPSTDIHATSIPTSIASILPSISPSTSMTTVPTLVTNNAVQEQGQLFSGDFGSWDLGSSSGGITNLIPASLLANPAVLPLLANLSASYPGMLNLNSGQVHTPIANIGANTGEGETPAPTSQTPAPVQSPAITTAFVGQQES